MAARARGEGVGLDEATQQGIIEAAPGRAIAKVVEAKEAVETLAGVEEVGGFGFLAPPSVAQGAIALAGADGAGARCDQRGRLQVNRAGYS